MTSSGMHPESAARTHALWTGERRPLPLAVRKVGSGAGLVLALLAGSSPADTGFQGWPALRGGPQAPGSLRWEQPLEGTLIPEWHYRGRANRRYKHGLAVWASPALAAVEDRPMAFIGGYDQTMHALDLLDKRPVWSRITNGEIQSEAAVGQVDGQAIVFWGSADRTVYAHRARDGQRFWTRELVPPTSTMGEARLSAPLLHGDTLYLSCFVYDKALARNRQTGWLYALNARTGNLLWRHEVSQGPVSSPVGGELDGRFTLFIAARKGLLQAVDVSGPTPRLLWRFQMPHEVLGSPAIQTGAADPLLFLGSKFGNLIALDARTGREQWQRMAGNWIDNTVAVGNVGGEEVVFAGSHDYHLYAFRAADGKELWRRRLGGEVYAAPSFFHLDDRPMVAAAALDDRIYVLDAETGIVQDAYRTGPPVWDLLSKGDILWASQAVLEAGSASVIVHGSYSDVVYVLPLAGDCSMRAGVQSPSTLWLTMLAVLAVFLLFILPPVLLLPLKGSNAGQNET